MRARTRSSIVAVIVGLAALTAAVGASDRPPPSLGRPLACARAQLVAGELRCDTEVLDDLRQRCAAAPAGTAALGPGDAVAVGACACERHPVLRDLGLGCDPGPTVGRMPPAELAALEQTVDLNRASAVELASLPGIGPALAQRIIDGRPYARVDAVIEVRGIGPKRLAAIRPRARVGGSSGSGG